MAPELEANNLTYQNNVLLNLMTEPITGRNEQGKIIKTEISRCREYKYEMKVKR
jgi:hypothetical protein